MMVTSFFPGRIRLRAPIFKDQALFKRAEGIIIKATDAIKRLENNPLTGSVLIEYDIKKLPLEKLASMQDFFAKLGKEAEKFSEENRSVIEKMLDEFEESLSKW